MSDEIIYYVMLNPADAAQLNQIMMNNYVFKNGEFVNGFDIGTLNYYDSDDQLQLVTPLLENAVNDLNISQSDRDFIAQILTTKKTRSEWVTMGAIQLVPPAPNPGN
jgi:hypothetical protein